MIVWEFKDRLVDMQYMEMKINFDKIYIYYIVDNQTVYVVNILEMDYGNEFNVEEFNHIRHQLKNTFVDKNIDEVRLLSVIFTKNVDECKKFSKQTYNLWIVDKISNKLIIYENQRDSFCNIKELIEDLLFEKLQNSNNSNKVNYLKNIGNNFIKQKLSKLSICNGAIILLNILVFLLVESRGSSEDSEYMLKWGAMYWPYIRINHEYYRLFSCMFLHFGIEHLLNNMLVLAFIGDYLERAMGKLKYITLYITAGVVASITSMYYNIYQGQEVIAAGASGAVFGVIGGMIFVLISNKGRLEDLNIRRMIIFVVLVLYQGITSQGIDNAAHIGGLIMGIILGAIFYSKEIE